MSPIERSAGGGGGFANPMTTQGDIIIENAVPTAARLAIGTTGQALEVSSGGLPAWQAPPGFQYDYVERNTSLTVTATTAATAQAVCDGAAVSYDGATRVKIEFGAGDVSTGTAGNLIFELWDGATDLGLIAAMKGVTGAGELPVYAVVFLTPSNASHTYHVKVWKSGATGTYSVNAGAAFSGSNPTAEPPTFMRITQA